MQVRDDPFWHESKVTDRIPILTIILHFRLNLDKRLHLRLGLDIGRFADAC